MANNYSTAVQGLISLGMTEREAKVYLALLEKDLLPRLCFRRCQEYLRVRSIHPSTAW